MGLTFQYCYDYVKMYRTSLAVWQLPVRQLNRRKERSADTRARVIANQGGIGYKGSLLRAQSKQFIESIWLLLRLFNGVIGDILIYE